MKLSEARESYYSNSARASELTRQLAFAGIALVWIFNSPVQNQSIALPRELMLVSLWLVLALILDFAQYVLGTLIWGFFSRRVEVKKPHRVGEDVEFAASPFMNWPGLICFWAKLAVLAFAYFKLGSFILTKLGPA